MLTEQNCTKERSWLSRTADTGEGFAELNPNVVLRCDADGVLLYCNPSAMAWRPTLTPGHAIALSTPELASVG